MHPQRPQSISYACARHLALVALLVPVVLTGCPFVPYGDAIYVNINNPSNIRDGKTWATAFHAIQAGIDAAQANGIGEVWVAEGTYDELRASASNGSLVMAGGINLYGGFSGTETQRSQRDPAQHRTVIDGSKASAGKPAWHVILGAKAALDGFTVTGGNADASLGETTGFGGGLYNYGASPTVANCIFEKNRAISGGAMYSYGADVEMTNCVLRDNTAMDGGAVYNASASITAANCLFYRNKASDGAGSALSQEYGASTLVNCTLYGNASRLGVVHALNAYPVVTNTIIWGNEGEAFSGDPATVIYSDIEGGYADVAHSNIDADPMFAGVSVGDLRIAVDSPCVDKGTANGAPSTDFAGAVRPQGGGVDMGAYEVMASGAPQAVFGVSPSIGAMPLLVEFSDQSWPGGAPITSWAWDFGDGTTSTLRNPTHTYAQVGTYDVSLTVTTSLGSDTHVATGAVTVNTAVLVNAGNVSGIENGTSWATAFRTIQPAIEKAALAEAGEVWVAAGTYKGTAETVVALREHVLVYGGFAGNETAREQRNWEQNVAIVDGEDVRRGVVGADNATFDGFTITRGHAADYGGGLYASETSPTVAHCVFTENTGQWGGAVFISAASPMLADCTFLRNHSMEGGYGGALFAGGGEPTVIRCAFTENDATSGGAVFSSGADGVLTNCTFTKNVATEAGALYVRAASTLVVTDCVFTENRADAAGGAARIMDASPTFSACTFDRNAAASNGGALASAEAFPTVNDCTFTENDSSNDGGALSVDGGVPMVSRCAFSNNSAARSGGALLCDDADFAVEASDFSGNAGSSGGAVFLRGGTGAISGCLFNANTGSQGAGLFASHGSTALLGACTFTRNAATDNGGGVSVNNAAPTLTNCVFWRNSAGWGAGMYLWGKASTPMIDSCSFGGNVATYEGAGMRNNMASPTIINSILWGDLPDEIAGVDDDPQYLYCDIQGGYLGIENINVPPLYADLSSGDLRIGYGSPCMNTGVEQGFPPTDVLDVERPQGGQADRGAFEVRTQGAPAAMFDVTPAKGIVPVTVQFTDRSWPGGAPITQWTWDFGDGETSNVASPSHTYATVGTYTVTLTVQTSLGSNVMSRAGCIVVQTPVHVDARNVSGSHDGLSWATAYATLRQGMDAAIVEEVSEVWAAAGTYTDSGDAVLALKPGVSVYGGFAGTELTRDERDADANVTTIDGQEVRRCVTGADGALLDGFTLTRGHDENYGGALYNSFVSPTIRHCTFTQNSANLGAAAFNSGGAPVYEACSFSKNATTDGGSGAAAFNTESSPQFLNCAFDHNVAYVGGAVFNQTAQALFTGASFYYNDAVQGGGMFNSGAAELHVTECSFVGNTCDNYGGAIFNGEAAAPLIDRSVFVDNSAAFGAAIGSDSASPIVANCVMYQNAASNGVGVYNRACSVAITNCTIADNTGSGFTAQAIRNEAEATARIANCVLWNPNMFELPLVPDESYTVTYSLIRNGFSGIGNIELEPLFVGVGVDAYALQAGSPGIDAGRDANVPALGSVTTDILGVPRGFDGDGQGATAGDGSEYDMGAYEYVP